MLSIEGKMKESSHDVFISYSSSDKTVAEAACHVIEEHGIRCWIAPRDVPPGSNYADVIDAAIIGCSVFVLIFSQEAAISAWVQSELNIAFSEQKHIIPFRIDDTPLRGANRLILNKTHWIDAFPLYEEKLAELSKSILRILGRDTDSHLSTFDSARRSKSLMGRVSLKSVLIVITIFFLCSAVTYYYSFYLRRQTFIYDENGLFVKTGQLDSRQSEALCSILNGMVKVEGGIFEMGNLPSVDMDGMRVEQDKYGDVVHPVSLSDFYICRHELTQEEWSAFVPLENYTKYPGGKNPVDYLSWDDCVQFTEILSSLTGLRFSLPTEAQWEFAARGGNPGKNRGNYYSGGNDAQTVGWIFSSSGKREIQPVERKTSNELGLYDMTGNVSEWCLDFFAEYPDSLVENPTGPNNGELRVLRGGDINTGMKYAKVTTRYMWMPSLCREVSGMRLVINFENDE